MFLRFAKFLHFQTFLTFARAYGLKCFKLGTFVCCKITRKCVKLRELEQNPKEEQEYKDVKA